MNVPPTMKAIVCEAFGPPQSLTFADVELPVMGEGEIRVRNAAAGVNFPDSMIIRGKYQLKPPMPFVPGFEFSGEIIALGAKVTGLALGQRVMGMASQGYGAFAQEVTARASEVTPIPAAMDYLTASALYTAYGTAFHALVQRGALCPGETLVVLGASGGVGLAAVDIGKALGAQVIAVCRTRERSQAASGKGADYVIAYTQEDVRQRILEITNGRGADICIDMLGGEAFHAMSRSMNWNGRLLVVGFTSGEVPKLAVNLALLRGYQVVGVYWAQFIARQPLGNAKNFEMLGRLVEERKIAPHIGGIFSLDRVPDAIDALLSRATIGKLLIDLRLPFA